MVRSVDAVAAANRAGEGTAGADAVLDDWIAPDLRAVVEDRFWAPIEQLTSLEAMVADPLFATDAGRCLALYSDHGPNHARDVAARAATLSEWAFGALFPDRPDGRAQLVTGAAVLMALIHDVGMCVVPPVGRRLHAQYAAQLVFSPAFSDVMDELLRTDAGRLRTGLERAGVADVPRVAREVLACAVAHSKSTVPAALLDDRAGFRIALQYVCRTDLLQQLDVTEREIDDDGSFAWLTDPGNTLADDVLDAIRLVRAADALRQRGTTLRTSAGWEIVIDPRDGSAITVVRSATRRSAYLLAIDEPIVVGEANIRTAELTESGLRFEFHCGALPTDAVERAVVSAVVDVIDDIQLDVLPTFPRLELPISFVEPDAGPAFADGVRRAFVAHRPGLAGRVRVVPGSRRATTTPRFRWQDRGRPLDLGRHQLVLERLAEHGARIVHPAAGMFAGTVVVDVERGEIVIEPGEDASFAIVAFEPGLVVTPLGGYRPAGVQPWVPVGTIGVLRGHDRNSTVVATEEMEVLVIPAEVFRTYWAEPFDPQALLARIAERPVQ